MIADTRVYIDAVIWIAAFDTSDPKHGQASNILDRLLDKPEHKSLFLSDYVFSEILSHITSKQKRGNISMDKRVEFIELVYESIYHSRFVEFIKVSAADVGTAIEYMRQYSDKTASLTDWLSLILMINNNIPVLHTFDRDFANITKTVDSFKRINVLYC